MNIQSIGKETTFGSLELETSFRTASTGNTIYVKNCGNAASPLPFHGAFMSFSQDEKVVPV